MKKYVAHLFEKISTALYGGKSCMPKEMGGF